MKKKIYIASDAEIRNLKCLFSNFTSSEWPYYFTYMRRQKPPKNTDFSVLKTKFSLVCLLHCHKQGMRTEQIRLHELPQFNFHLLLKINNSYQYVLWIYFQQYVYIIHFDSVPLKQGISDASCRTLYQMVCIHNWKH